LFKKNRWLSDVLLSKLRYFEPKLAIPIGSGIYKLRLEELNKGKSGGYRVYIFTIEIHKIIVPITIFSKSERSDMSWKELVGHLKATKIELKME